MEIYFDNWIKEQDVSNDAQVLFDESIICYRVGAYRAAFIMSYLGFFKELKYRLIRSETPELMKEKEGAWDKLVKKMKGDSEWEEAVFQATQMRIDNNETTESRSRVFLITIDIMEEIPFWRRKRNECAHAKDTVISHSHVEMFWLFLQSHLSKFVVNGGKQALLGKIKKHFDPNFTKPGTDRSYLIKDIPLVVKKSAIPELLKEINEDFVDLIWRANKYEYLFWKEIAYSTNKDLEKAFLEFMTSDEEVFVEFIEAFPDKLPLFGEKEELMRPFWKEKLFKEIGSFSTVFWDLAVSLLTNNIVPKDEIEPFVKRLSYNLNSVVLPNEQQMMILKKYGILNEVRKSVFLNSSLNQAYTGYAKANQHAQKIIFYLENEALDNIVVDELNTLFKSYSFGVFYERMEDFMEKHRGFIHEFRAIADKEGIELADFFIEQAEENEE